jgi:hypothetical protein
MPMPDELLQIMGAAPGEIVFFIFVYQQDVVILHGFGNKA